MSYRILSSNVIVGDANTTEYAFVTTPDGALQMERLDGNAALFEVGGNLQSDHLFLTTFTDPNKVIMTDGGGRLRLTDFDANFLGNASALTTGVLPSDRLQGSYTLANLTASGTVSAASLVGNMDTNVLTSGTLNPSRLAGEYAFANLTLSNTLTANTLSANVDAGDITSGTLHNDRLQGTYAFDALTLTGNLYASSVLANVDAADITSGTISDDRLVGSYAFDTLTVTGTTTSNSVHIPTLLGSNVLISDGTGHIVHSNVTNDELAFVSGVTGPIQLQINELANGNIVGSNITNLDANNVSLGILPGARLAGDYAFANLALTGSLVANAVYANLDASQLITGTIPSARLAGSYTLANLVVNGSLDAASVSANLNASQLTSGTVPNERLQGSYTFESLDLAGNLAASHIHANIDAGNIVSGTIDHARLDLEGLQTNIIPATTGLSIGSSASPWTEVHVQTVHVDDIDLGNGITYRGNAVVLDLEQTTSNIVPAGAQYTLGSSANPWSTVYAANIVAASNVVVGGSLLKADGISPYIDLGNVETNVLPVVGGLNIGTVDRPWAHVTTDAATFQSLGVRGNVTSNINPGGAYDLGSPAQPWGNVYANEIVANIEAVNVYGEIDASIVFAGGSLDDFVIKVPAGSQALPGLRFTADQETGLYLPSPGTLGISCGNTAALQIDASTILVAGNVVPSAHATYDLGNVTNSWNDMYVSNAVYAGPVVVDASGISGSQTLDVSGTVTCHDLTATGTVAASTVTGNLDASYLKTGTIDGARLDGSYTFANLAVTGDLSVGGTTTIQPTGHILPASNLSFDLGSATNVWRDLYLSGSTIHLGNATIQETGGNVVISKLQVTGSIVADGLVPDMTISNVQITDIAWTVLDDTVVSSDGGYFLINGTGYGPGTLCQVGGTNAVSTSYVSSTQLRVQVGARASGTYSLTAIRGDTQTATFPAGITYSDAVVWTTSSNLGTVVEFQSFSIPLVATSDSNVIYGNTSALPPETTLDPVSGNLVGNITSALSSTLYSFDVAATDEELQNATRTFLLQLVVMLINATQYTDGSWTPLTQTALDSNTSSVYWTINGSGMTQVTSVSVGGTAATSFTAVSDSVLRVTGPQKARGTYDVTLGTPATTKTFANAVFYSDVPQWITSATLANVNSNTTFTTDVLATSDSSVTYTSSGNLPPNTTLDASTGRLTGNVSVTSDTLISFILGAMDAEMQLSLRTFQLQVKVPFYDSTILAQSGYGYDLQAAARNLLKPAWSQHGTLVYRASDHGYTAAAFHSYCDGIPQLFIVIRANTGYIATAYTVVPFTSSNTYKSAPYGANWLNRLYPSGYQNNLFVNSNQPTHLIGNFMQYSIYDGVGYGPTFGAGHDLYVPNNFDTTAGYTNTPYTYGAPTNSTLFGNYNTWTVLDMEAYAVVPPPFIPPNGTIPTGITYSQSSVYIYNSAATASDMQNNTPVPSTQTGTSAGAFEWVQMDLQQVYRVTNVVIGCDFYNLLPGGWNKSYAENRDVQYSTDGSNWTTLFNTGTFTEGIQRYAVDVDARYIRIVNSGHIAITQFYAVY